MTLRSKLILSPPQSPQAYVGLGCLALASFVTAYVALNYMHDAFLSLDDDPQSSRVVLSIEPLTLSPMMPATQSPAPSKAEPASLEDSIRTVEIQSGGTLLKLLSDEGVTTSEAQEIITAFGKVFPTRKLKPGHNITLTCSFQEDTTLRVDELRFRPSLDLMIVVTRGSNGTYKAKEVPVALEKEMRRVSGLINTSVFGSMMNRGVRPAAITTLIQAFSYDIDFQRDVQPDDSFEVVVERYFDPQTGAERSGDVVYAALNISGKDYKLYAFQPKGGSLAFYNEHGEGVKKAFLRTPIDGGRISSGFGNRMHPVLGFTKMHKGVDFAVPTGTPIVSAGEGVVERVGRFGAYGNYVRVRHSGGYATAYAHLSKFAQIRPGARIKQGQILGYVGATGRTTGPHLHYEVLKNGVQINPKIMANASLGAHLSGADKRRFKELKGRISRQIAKLGKSETVLAYVNPSAPSKRSTSRV